MEITRTKKTAPTFDDYIASMKRSYAYFCRDYDERNENVSEVWSYRESRLLESMTTIYKKVMFDYLADNIKLAMKNDELETLRSLLYQSTFIENVPAGLAKGADHTCRFFEAMNYISCLGFDVVYRIFPKGIPQCANGYPVLLENANLLLCLLYDSPDKKLYDEEKIVEKAEKALSKKSDKVIVSTTKCLLGILKHNTDLFNEGLKTVVANYNRQELNSSEKVLCQLAVALIVIAKKFLSEEEFKRIEFPVAKNFSKKYCEHILSKDSFEPKIFYEYPDELSPLNKIALTPVPVTKLHKPYFDKKQYSKKEQNENYIDAERMAIDFILEFRKIEQENNI